VHRTRREIFLDAALKHRSKTKLESELVEVYAWVSTVGNGKEGECCSYLPGIFLKIYSKKMTGIKA